MPTTLQRVMSRHPSSHAGALTHGAREWSTLPLFFLGLSRSKWPIRTHTPALPRSTVNETAAPLRRVWQVFAGVWLASVWLSVRASVRPSVRPSSRKAGPHPPCASDAALQDQQRHADGSRNDNRVFWGHEPPCLVCRWQEGPIQGGDRAARCVRPFCCSVSSCRPAHKRCKLSSSHLDTWRVMMGE